MKFKLVCSFLLLIFFATQLRAEGIYFAGLGLDRIEQIFSYDQKQHRYLHHDSTQPIYCLSVIERSPLETRKVYYSILQFIELLKTNRHIKNTVKEILEIDVDRFLNHVKQNFSIQDLMNTCINLGLINQFQKHSEKANGEVPIIDNWKLKQSILNRAKLEKSEKFRIRTYNDPLSEKEAKWRFSDAGPKEVREVNHLYSYLFLAYKFLFRYKTATNVRVFRNYNNTPLSDLENYFLSMRPQKNNLELDIKNNQFDNSPSDDLENFDPTEWEKSLDHLEDYDEVKNNSSNHHIPTTKGRIKSVFSRKRSSRVFSLVDIEKGSYLKFYSIDKVLPWEATDLFKELNKLEDRRIRRIDYFNRFYNRESRSTSQSIRSKQTRIEEILNKKGLNLVTHDELAEVDRLKKELYLGIKKNNLKKYINAYKNTKYEQSFRKIKKGPKAYNRYGTDFLVDLAADQLKSPSLKQLLPMSKKRARAYKLVKALDSLQSLFLNIATPIVAPFTAGLSFLGKFVFDATNVLIFSIATSLARNEPLKWATLRGFARLSHSMTENQVPYLGQVNGIFTGLDDMRAALNLNEEFNRRVLRKSQVTKERWDTLGSPLVISLIHNRLNYLENGLLPRGKFIFTYAILSSSEKRQMRKLLQRLVLARNGLHMMLIRSVLRYQSLLLRGKVPLNFIPEILFQLRENERFSSYFNNTAAIERHWWKKMENNDLSTKRH